jgi:hypothetical protein
MLTKHFEKEALPKGGLTIVRGYLFSCNLIDIVEERVQVEDEFGVREYRKFKHWKLTDYGRRQLALLRQWSQK